MGAEVQKRGCARHEIKAVRGMELRLCAEGIETWILVLDKFCKEIEAGPHSLRGFVMETGTAFL